VNYFSRPAVSFQVSVDGVKRWESGAMKLCDPAKWVDIDISGAKELELTALEAVKTDPAYACNWSDWAEARLLQ